MSFSLTQLIEARQADQYDLHMKYISPHMARVQKIIGFDKLYTHGAGAYLWDVDGNRYLDLLSGYSVFNLGRGHPVIKQAMEEALMLDPDDIRGVGLVGRGKKGQKGSTVGIGSDHVGTCIVNGIIS